jgi:hypothetical protein
MKRKVTDLKPNEAILISNDSERDAILQLMEDAGYIWANRDKPTHWMPMFPYPLCIEIEDMILFNNESYLYEQMEYTIHPATDFIGSEGVSESNSTLYSVCCNENPILRRKDYVEYYECPYCKEECKVEWQEDEFSDF